MRTIFEISPNVRLPVKHWYYWLSAYRTPCYYCDFCIRPKVFQNFVGAQSDRDVLRVKDDPTNLGILINAFVEIVFLIKSQFSIEYATIAYENEGRGHAIATLITAIERINENTRLPNLVNRR